MIGLFVNTLVFRADFANNLSFRDLIRQVRGFALEAYTHQDMPFEKLVEELVPQRSLDTPPLFQVMFTFQNIPKQALGNIRSQDQGDQFRNRYREVRPVSRSVGKRRPAPVPV